MLDHRYNRPILQIYGEYIISCKLYARHVFVGNDPHLDF